ncbi:MAG TPA: hypothetical protein VJW20_07315 [Candidatus Angelobacter sp.]|nr:hypothetical protein [Candidatus Angelobacter sp.]
MKVISSSVGFQDQFGNLLSNGSLIFTLQQQGIYLVLAGGGQVVSRSFLIKLDASAKVPAGIQVWASDELAGTPVYTATLCKNSDGTSAVGSVNWLISGTGPIDLSQLPAH